MSSPKVTALVTGASSGLGAEFCRQLAGRCEVIIAVARRSDHLQKLQRELAGQVEVHAVVADLGGVEGLARAMEALRQLGPVDYLVNNAGFGVYGDFAALDIESQRAMVNLHIDATITLCRAAIGFMRERGGGHIINVASARALLAGEGRAVYGASKAFLVYFSEALHAELAGTGIEVQALCPGYVRTEFHRELAPAVFDRDSIPAAQWMEAGAVVAASLAVLGKGQVLVLPDEGTLSRVRGAARFNADPVA